MKSTTKPVLDRTDMLFCSIEQKKSSLLKELYFFCWVAKKVTLRPVFVLFGHFYHEKAKREKQKAGTVDRIWRTEPVYIKRTKEEVILERIRNNRKLLIT